MTVEAPVGSDEAQFLQLLPKITNQTNAEIAAIKAEAEGKPDLAADGEVSAVKAVSADDERLTDTRNPKVTTVTTGSMRDLTTAGDYDIALTVTDKPANLIGSASVHRQGSNVAQEFWGTAGGTYPTVKWTNRRISGTWTGWEIAGPQGPFMTANSDFDDDEYRRTGTRPNQFTDLVNQPFPNAGTLETLPGPGLPTHRYTTWETPARVATRRAINSSTWSVWDKNGAGAEVTSLTSRVSQLEVAPAGGDARSFGAYAPTLTATSPSNILTTMSADKTRGWNGYGQSLKQTTDEGLTWTTLHTFAAGVTIEGVTLLGDGELLISTMDAGTTYLRRLYRTSGVAANTAVTVTQVMAPRARSIKYTTAWSISTFENIVVVGEYGPKLGSLWAGLEVLPGENARYVYLSTNNGATFTQVFDLNTYLTNRGAGTDGQHVHGVAWDQYWDRLWVSFGDTADGIVYSDDSGASWLTASWAPTSPSPTQVVGIVPMPNCVLFGGDTTPQVQRIKRSPGKAGPFELDVAYELVGFGSHLMQAHLREFASDGSVVAYMGFGAEGVDAPSFIVKTRDGTSFTKIWQDDVASDSGLGLRTMAVTGSGQLVVGSNDAKDPGGLWSVYRGTDPGSPNAGVLYSAATPSLAVNLVPDPQVKTSGGTAGNSAHPFTRITTGLPAGFSYGLSTARAGTLNTVIAQLLLGGTSNANPLKAVVAPGDVLSFSAMAWTDQSAARARLDVRWYSSADTLLSTTTGSYVPLAASTWQTFKLEGVTAPASAAYAVLVPLIATISGNTVTGALSRMTGAAMNKGSTVTPYADGTRTSTGWAWTGAAHASTSKKSFVALGDYASPAEAAVAAAAGAATALAYLGPRADSIPNPVPGYTLPVTVRRTAFGYTAQIDHEAMHVKTAGSTLYVDPVAGSNSNDGLTWATAKKDPGNALSAGSTYTVAEVIVRGGIYTRAQSTVPVGIAGSRPDVVVRAEPGTRPVFTQCDTSASWTVHSGTTHKVALSGPGMVIDLNAPKSDAGLPIPLTKVANAAAVVATAGTAYHDGTTQYVHLFDNRAPDVNVLVSRSTYHLNTTSADPGVPFRILLEGIEFWGGLYARVKGWRAGDQIVAKGCAWRFANENGIGLQAVNGVFIDCEATHNGIDGFNYHDVDGRSGQALEVNCVGRFNGRDPAGSSQNGTTAHENYKVVRVGGVYEYNPGPNVADVGNVLSANFGTSAGSALGYAGVPDYDFTGPETGGKTWLIGCRSSSSLAIRNAQSAKLLDFQRIGTLDGVAQPYL